MDFQTKIITYPPKKSIKVIPIEKLIICSIVRYYEDKNAYKYYETPYILE